MFVLITFYIYVYTVYIYHFFWCLSTMRDELFFDHVTGSNQRLARNTRAAYLECQSGVQLVAVSMVSL